MMNFGAKKFSQLSSKQQKRRARQQIEENETDLQSSSSDDDSNNQTAFIHMSARKQKKIALMQIRSSSTDSEDLNELSEVQSGVLSPRQQIFSSETSYTDDAQINVIDDGNDEIEDIELESNEDANSSIYLFSDAENLVDDVDFVGDVGEDELFVSELQDFCLRRLPDVATNELLQMLHRSNKFQNLPTNHEELYYTPNVQMPLPVAISGGEYLHIGIRANLQCINIEQHNVETITLNFSWDGVRLFKSSSRCIWPIVMDICEVPDIDVMLVGVYIGNTKPANPNEFFYCLNEETKEICLQGSIVEVGLNKKRCKLDARCFIADTPARTWALGTVGHTGYSSCNYCWQVGTYQVRRIVFESKRAKPRTDEEFRRYADPNHQTSISPFVENPLVHDMIYSFPLDSMHALDLGVMRKIFVLLIANGSFDVSKADSFVAEVKKYISKDFTRKPRPFGQLEHFKASELRLFALYLGPVLLRICCNHSDKYENFMNFFIGYRLLMGENGIVSEENCQLADTLLQCFVQKFQELYRELSFNFHAILHLAEIVRKHGPLDKFSAYRYENFYQLFRLWIRKPTDLFKQIWTRWTQTQGTVQRKNASKRKFGFDALEANKKDGCVMRQDKTVFVLMKKKRTLTEVYFVAKRFNTIENFFITPIHSSRLNMFLVSNLNDEEEIIRLDEIEKKMLRIPYLNKFVVMPIIHT